jgi:hypothetical protein
LLLVAFLTTGPLFVAYANPNVTPFLQSALERFCILLSVPFCLAIGAGAYLMLERAPRLVLVPD